MYYYYIYEVWYEIINEIWVKIVLIVNNRIVEE